MREDHIIEERNQKSYLAEYSSPVLTVPCLSGFKADKNCNLKNKILAKIKDLKNEYQQLEDLYHYNSFIDSFEYSFIPVQGHVYYLYENEGRRFMSLISPDDFVVKYSYLGCCRYNGSGYFERV